MRHSEELAQFDPEMLEGEYKSIRHTAEDGAIENSKFEGLTERDKALFRQAGENVFRRIMHDFPQELPDAVLLPDTSGRALWRLAKPVFDKLATQRGVDAPKYFFISTVKNGLVEAGLALESQSPSRMERAWEAQSSVLDQRRQNQKSQIELNAARFAHQNLPENNNLASSEAISRQSDAIDEIITQPETDESPSASQSSPEVKGWRQKLANIFTSRQAVSHVEDSEAVQVVEALSDADTLHAWRINQIKDAMSDSSDQNFIILDEYMTGFRSTAKLIQRGLGKAVPTYALASTEADWKTMRNYSQTHIGALVPDNESYGFDLRYTKDATGVTKDKDDMINPYATEVMENRPQARLLREQLGEIGEEIAQSILHERDDASGLSSSHNDATQS